MVMKYIPIILEALISFIIDCSIQWTDNLMKDCHVTINWHNTYPFSGT